MPITNNHFNYHSSSITETSRATISLEHPDAPSEQNSHVLFKERKNTNGQQKDSKTCSNGEVDMLNKMETTNDGGDGCGAKHHLYVDAERQETQKTELAGEFS